MEATGIVHKLQLSPLIRTRICPRQQRPIMDKRLIVIEEISDSLSYRRATRTARVMLPSSEALSMLEGAGNAER